MIPLMKVHTPPNIGKVLQRVWDSGFITEGEYSDRFEEEFGKYIGNSKTIVEIRRMRGIVSQSKIQ